MVKVFPDKFKKEDTGLKTDGYYIDDGLKKELDFLKKAVKDDWDGVILIDGVEGGGKSVFAQQIGYYLDPKLDIENIVFNGDDFIKRATEMKEKHRVVIFDEAFAGLSSRSAMSQMNKNITRMLMEIRQKNLFLILILPTFFELDRYAAIFRSRCLINIKANHFVRGYWDLYGYRKKLSLYMYGKKYYNYSIIKSDLKGRFTAFSPIDQEKYKEKKEKSLRAAFEPEDPKKRYAGVLERYELELVSNALMLRKKYNLKKYELAEILNMSADKLFRKVQKTRDLGGVYMDTYEEGGESEERE